MATPANFSCAGTRANLLRLDAWFEAFCARHGMPAGMTHELRVCLHELAANIVIHGGACGPPPFIQASATLVGSTVILSLHDDAPAFDPAAVRTAALAGTLEDARIGGLGLHLVHSFADVLRYRRQDGHNHVTLIRGPRPAA